MVLEVCRPDGHKSLRMTQQHQSAATLRPPLYRVLRSGHEECHLDVIAQAHHLLRPIVSRSACIGANADFSRGGKQRLLREACADIAQAGDVHRVSPFDEFSRRCPRRAGACVVVAYCANAFGYSVYESRWRHEPPSRRCSTVSARFPSVRHITATVCADREDWAATFSAFCTPLVSGIDGKLGNCALSGVPTFSPNGDLPR